MIPIKAKELKSLKDRAIGLIGKQKVDPVYFKTRWGIHTFGLKFPIDILILDKEKRVVALKKTLKPNRIFFWNPRFDRVLELSNGSMQRKNIQVGETIQLDLSNE